MRPTDRVQHMTEGASDDARWFEEAVLALLPDLLSGARRMASGQADAEDLVAEAVARGWERRAELRDRVRLRGWLFRILRNTYLTRLRKERARPDEVPLSEGEPEEAHFSLFNRLHQPFLLWWGNTEEQFLNGLVKEDLERAVDALPEPYRTVVVLADVQGFKYAEIAEALDVPVGTVRSRLARARARLQEGLWQHAVDAGLRGPGRSESWKGSPSDPSGEVGHG